MEGHISGISALRDQTQSKLVLFSRDSRGCTQESSSIPQHLILAIIIALLAHVQEQDCNFFQFYCIQVPVNNGSRGFIR